MLVPYLRCLPIVDPGDNFDCLCRFSSDSSLNRPVHCDNRWSATCIKSEVFCSAIAILRCVVEVEKRQIAYFKKGIVISARTLWVQTSWETISSDAALMSSTDSDSSSSGDEEPLATYVPALADASGLQSAARARPVIAPIEWLDRWKERRKFTKTSSAIRAVRRAVSASTEITHAQLRQVLHTDYASVLISSQ